MEKTEKYETAGSTTGDGVASLVTGILSLVLMFAPYIALPLGIMAVIFAHYQDKKKPTGTATAGRVLGILGIVFNAIVLFCVIVFIAMGGLNY